MAFELSDDSSNDIKPMIGRRHKKNYDGIKSEYIKTTMELNKKYPNGKVEIDDPYGAVVEKTKKMINSSKLPLINMVNDYDKNEVLVQIIDKFNANIINQYDDFLKKFNAYLDEKITYTIAL
jgi:hypothetical protein